MARNKKVQNSLIDFDSGGSIVDPTAILRNAQNRLYKLNNPYVGSKRNILPDIENSLLKHNVKHEKILDLFSGSGVVSIFFKILGKEVISNDLLTSSYFNALSFCENNSISLTKEQIQYLCKNNNPNKGNWIAKNYSKWFSDTEAQFLDNYRANVSSLKDQVSSLSQTDLNAFKSKEAQDAVRVAKIRQGEIIEALAIVSMCHYVMDHCFLGGRLNHGQILANFEHRIKHDRNKGHEMMFNIPALPQFNDGKKQCYSYNMDALIAARVVQIDNSDIDLAYLDPPYGQAQSDYAGMYKFCEEYVYSQQLDTISHIADASQKFSKAKNYQEHFRQVLNEIKNIPTWAVSFNASSFSDASGIVNILKDFKTNVEVVNIDHEYRYRKSRSKAVEYLFIAR